MTDPVEIHNGLLQAAKKPTEPPDMHLYGCRIHGNPAPLFAALALAQGTFGQIERTKHVKIEGKAGKPGYEFDYAPLDEVLKKTVPHLSANGLCLLNTLGETEDGTTVLGCMLAHSSGAFLFQYMKVPPMQRYWDYDNKEWRERAKTNQEMASDVTYRRRYMDGGILCVAPEMDDDGAASSNDTGQFSNRAKPQPATSPTPPKVEKPKPAAQAAPGKPFGLPSDKDLADQRAASEAFMKQQQDAQGNVLVSPPSAPEKSAPPPPQENGAAPGMPPTKETREKVNALIKKLGMQKMTAEWTLKVLGKPREQVTLEAEMLVLLADLEARDGAAP
jgi:hypothetical protein